MLQLRRAVAYWAILTSTMAKPLAIPRENSVAAYAGCGKQLPAHQTVGGVSNVTIESDGIQRNYLISIPPTYNHNNPTPLILSYHGGVRTAEDQLQLDKLTDPYFNTVSMVVYPQGLGNTWQGVPNVTTNDVLFTTNILNEVENLYCINPSRISATGKSDGAGFCNVLACDRDLSKRFAAFAPVSGAYYIDELPCYPANITCPCSAGRSDVPMLAFHGGNDTTIAYNGGERKNECLPTIPHFIQEWALRNNMNSKNSTMPVAADTVKYTFGIGPQTGLVGLYYESNIGHDWPSTQPNADNTVAGHHVADYNATPIILEFFESHTLSLLETLEEIF